MIHDGIVYDSMVDLYFKHKELFRTLRDGEDIYPYDIYVAEHGQILTHSGAEGKSQGKIDVYSYMHFRLKDKEQEKTNL